MTLERIRDQARRYARIDSTAASDAQVNKLIQDAVDKMSRDVGGFPLDVNLYPTASFDTETNFALRITIAGTGDTLSATDVAITSTARENATGDTVASDLQTAINAATGGSGCTVTWTNFYFTVAVTNATSITFASPSATTTYVDATDILGLSGTASAASFTGSFPQDCTKFVTIPTAALAIDRVEWDYDELRNVPLEYVQSPEAHGDPTVYAVRDRRMYFSPVPDSFKRLEIWYRGLPDEIDFSGYQELDITGLTYDTDTGLSATTAYYFKVSVDGGPSLEYDITTASDTSYNAVIVLMNAEVNNKCTFTVTEDGYFRCSSDKLGAGSSISLAAGTSGTDLFASLTGWNAFLTASLADINPPTDVPADYHEALQFLVAYFLLLEAFDEERARMRLAQYGEIMRRLRVEYANHNTPIEDNYAYRRLPAIKSRQGFS